MRSGQRVLAFDLTPAPLQRLVEHKVEAAKSAVDVMRQCDIVFVSLPSGKQLDKLANGRNGLLKHARAGQTLVDLGTSPVALTRKLAAAFAIREVDYLDAPVGRVAAPFSPVPFSPALEKHYVPSAKHIVAMVRKMLGLGTA